MEGFLKVMILISALLFVAYFLLAALIVLVGVVDIILGAISPGASLSFRSYVASTLNAIDVKQPKS